MLAWIGVALSYVFVFAVIGLSTALLRAGRLRPAAARKLVHIGVSNWWLIAMATMHDPWTASIGPASFVLLNALSLRRGLFAALEAGKRERSWGTVYFPVSLLILVNLCYRGLMPVYVGGMATLIMGWGDGLAAMVGSRWGSRRIGPKSSGKSIAGSAAMFVVSAAVTAVFASIFEPDASPVRTLLLAPAATAAVATVVELFTPWGIDNLSVPLVSAVFYRLVLLA